MKKIFLFMSLAMAALTFTSCGDDDTPPPAPAPKPSYNIDELIPLMAMTCAGETQLSGADNIVEMANRMGGVSAEPLTDQSVLYPIEPDAVGDSRYRIYSWGEKRSVYDVSNKKLVDVPENIIMFIDGDNTGYITAMKLIALRKGWDTSIYERAMSKMPAVLAAGDFTYNPTTQFKVTSSKDTEVFTNLSTTIGDYNLSIEDVKSKNQQIIALFRLDSAAASADEKARVGECSAEAIRMAVVETTTCTKLSYYNRAAF